MAILKEKNKTTNKPKKPSLNASPSCFTMNFKIGGLEKLWQEAEIKQIITVWEHKLSNLPSAPWS